MTTDTARDWIEQRWMRRRVREREASSRILLFQEDASPRPPRRWITRGEWDYDDVSVRLDWER